METTSELGKHLWEIWTEMFKILFEFLLKAVVVLLWILCGVIILPCAFIAGNLYPKWTEWGDKL